MQPVKINDSNFKTLYVIYQLEENSLQKKSNGKKDSQVKMFIFVKSDFKIFYFRWQR